MGLLDSSAAGLGSLAAAPPLPAASDKYSAAHMEACLKHQFGEREKREGGKGDSVCVCVRVC